MATPRVWAVIVAAGWGERFGGPKQFAELGGARLVDHAVDTAAGSCDAVVLVVPDAADWQGAEVDALVTGGATRAESVRAGLGAVPAGRRDRRRARRGAPAGQHRPLRRGDRRGARRRRRCGARARGHRHA